MSQERDICIRCGRPAVIIVCLAPPSSLVSTRHYLPSAPPNSHRSLTQMPPKPPKTNEKISLVAIEKYSRENISDKTAQIFLLSLREWRARRSKLPAEQIQQNVATVIASQPFVFSRIVPHHYQPKCHATITGASHNSPIIGRAAFRGGHPFEHRDVLAPGLACPSLDHHGLSAGERTDLDRRAETLLTGTTGGTKRWQSGERAFSGRCLSRCLSVSLLLPPGAACASLTSLAACWRETAALVFAWKESPR